VKNNFINLIKGFIIGIGKIIPGVSGSLLAISLGIYERCIDIIANLFVEIKYNLEFLFFLCLGIFLAIIFGSRVIYYFITNYYFLTMCMFIGMIGGTLPNIFRKIKLNKKKDLLFIFTPFLLIMFISLISVNNKFVVKDSLISYFIVVIIGFFDALTMIVPGISGTSLFMVFGVYDFVLDLFQNPFNPLIILFSLGLFIGILEISRIMNYFFKNFNTKVYLFIVGLSLASLFSMTTRLFVESFTMFEFFFGIVLIILGSFLSMVLDEK